MVSDLHKLAAFEAGIALRCGDLSSVALTEASLARIARLEPALHCFNLVTWNRALEDAERADRELAAGRDRGPLHGIPYALKDIYATAGIQTTCNSRLQVDHVPHVDSFVETKLRTAGAVLIGKLATHEFAFGGPSFDLPFPPARNPWNPEHFTGGSSSGSGAAIAAGFVRVALGSDTGGSIRSPASHCGVVGLKPTYGRVSRRGVYPLSYSLDHCGPLTWNVMDCALAMNVIAGFDALDSGSANISVPDFTSQIGKGIAGLRIAYARDAFTHLCGISSEVITVIDDAVGHLVGLGVNVEEVTLPDLTLFHACNRIILTAEAFAIHEENLRTRPLDYGRYTYQRLAAGATITASDFIQAQRLRRELAIQVDTQLFPRYDALVTATALAPAPRLDEFPIDWLPLASSSSVLTAPFNVTGHPSLAVPAGFSRLGLPVGLQIVGRAFDEQTLFCIAEALERDIGITSFRPNPNITGAPPC